MGAYTPLHVITPERISPIGHQNANAVNGPSTGVVHGILRAMLSDLAAVTREQLEVLALDVPDRRQYLNEWLRWALPSHCMAYARIALNELLFRLPRTHS